MKKVSMSNCKNPEDRSKKSCCCGGHGCHKAEKHDRETIRKAEHTVDIPPTYLNSLASEIYKNAQEKGFHSGPPDMAKFTSNLHSEISELWEAYRKNELYTPCSKAVKMAELGVEPLSCIAEELADIIIRALDTAYTYDVDIDVAIKSKMKYNSTRPFRHGGKKA